MCGSLSFDGTVTDRASEGIGSGRSDRSEDSIYGDLVRNSAKVLSELSRHNVSPDGSANGRSDGITDLSPDEDKGSDRCEILVRYSGLGCSLSQDSSKATTCTLEELNDDKLCGGTSCSLAADHD